MVTFSVLRCLSRSTVTGTVVPGVSAMTVCTSSSRDAIGRLLTSRITSPGSIPALAAGPLWRHRRDQRAGALLQAELLERLTRHRLHLTRRSSRA